MREKLDQLESLKTFAVFHGKTKTIPNDRYQWTAITAQDCELLASLSLTGFRITVSSNNLQALEKTIDLERRKVEAAEWAERRKVEKEEEETRKRERDQIEAEMRARYSAPPTAPAPAPAVDPQLLSALIAQAVAAAMATQHKSEPETK